MTENIDREMFESEENCKVVPDGRIETFDRITIVTMCFNLGMKRLSRIKSDNRENYYDFYITSLMRMIDCCDNVVCFCDKECAVHLRKEGYDDKVYLIEMELDELPLYNKIELYEEKYAKMQRHVDFLKKVNFPKKRHGSFIVKFSEQASPRDMAYYALLNHSKVSLMRRATQQNPYNTKYFYWLDAGCLQEKYDLFWEGFTNRITHIPVGIRIVIHTPNFSTIRMKFHWSLYNIAYGWIPDQMEAMFFGGTLESIMHFADEFEYMIDRFLKHDVISSEQAIITYMVKQHPSDFDVVINKEYYRGSIEKIANGERKGY